MSPWSIAGVTGVVVVTGKWANKKTVGFTEVGAAFWYVLVMALAQAVNEDFAKAFAILVLIAAMLEYTVPIAQGLGLVSG